MSEPLRGGDVTEVERIGDAVRRTTGPWSPSVHALLRHLEAVGFDACPRVIGVDDDGRERLSYIDGEVPVRPRPAWATTDDTLVAVIELLRRYHDAVASFEPPSGARWRIWVGAPTSGPIIGHNDVVPSNVVFRGGQPVALIDWDMAAPATPLWDLAAAAKAWIPLMHPERAARHGWPDRSRAQRLRLLGDAYGLTGAQRDELLDLSLQRQIVTLTTYETWGRAGAPGFVELWQRGTADRVRSDIEWLQASKTELSRISAASD